MARLPTHQLRNVGILLGLGLAMAAVACGDEGSSSSSNTQSSSSSASSSSSSGTGGAGGGTGGAGGGTGGMGGGTGGMGGGTGGNGGSQAQEMSFFVSSTGSKTANLGGLVGADKRCQDLATAVGAGAKTWHAYLSIEKGPDDKAVHAKDRIGTGPWYNAKGVMIAADLKELHERFGDSEVFLDEKGAKVPGQWTGSPTPNEHDILTGTARDGTVVVGQTCADWTSEDSTMAAQVGHSDGLGPGGSSDPMYRPWNSVHTNESCADTAPRGGSGRVYCFATN